MSKTKEIILTGVESSGKSTLAQALCTYHKGIYIAEYSRIYLENIIGNYTEKDVEYIALGQYNLQIQAQEKQTNDTFIFLDTDVLVCKIWYEFKYKKSSQIINELWAKQSADLYILCDIDIPWQADPLRETPDKNIRQELLTLYEKELKKANRPYIFVKGNLNSRLQQVNQTLLML